MPIAPAHPLPSTPARFTGPWAPKPMGMNRKRVIVWMTAAVAFMLAVPMSAIFGGIPPWPIVFWFVVSHVVFCLIIARVKPYTGPYVEPMAEPTPDPPRR